MLKTTRRKLILGSLASLVAAGINTGHAKIAKSESTKAQSSTDSKLPTSLRVKAVVIGSGFGGSVAAYHLGRNKVETLVLERGRRWDVKEGQPGPFTTSKLPDGRALWLSEKIKQERNKKSPN